MKIQKTPKENPKSGLSKKTKPTPGKKKTRKPNPNRKVGSVPLISRFIADGAVLKHIQNLVKDGARVSAGDSYNSRPLHYASAAGDVSDIVQFLVDSGANVLARNTAGQTALDVAREKNADDLTIAILEKAEKGAGSGRSEN